MAEKSILIVGSIIAHTSLLIHALTNGYQIFCVPKLKDEMPFLDQEDLRLVIVDDSVGYTDSMWDRGFMDLVESEVPVLLAGKERLGNTILEIFQDLISAPSQELQSKEDVGNLVEFLPDETQREAMDTGYLVYKRANDSSPLEPNENGVTIQGRVKRAIGFMEEHYSDSISLEQIAHAAYLSSYHFCRLFKKQTGITCSKYPSILRVEKAKQLLKETDLSVTSVCCETGFNSLAYQHLPCQLLMGESS